jgi:hypothetical protein
MLKTFAIGFGVAIALAAGALGATTLHPIEIGKDPAALHAGAARDLHDGAQYAYEVSTTRTITDAAGKEVTKTTIAGTLVLTVVGKTPEGAAIHAELRYASRVDAPAVTSSAHELGQPFFMSVRPDGSVASFGFMKEMSPEARRHLRAIVSAVEIAKGAISESPFEKEERFEGRVLTTTVKSSARAVAKEDSRALAGSYEAAKPSFDADGEGR